MVSKSKYSVRIYRRSFGFVFAKTGFISSGTGRFAGKGRRGQGNWRLIRVKWGGRAPPLSASWAENTIISECKESDHHHSLWDLVKTVNPASAKLPKDEAFAMKKEETFVVLPSFVAENFTKL
jgi:hypothetical protein